MAYDKTKCLILNIWWAYERPAPGSALWCHDEAVTPSHCHCFHSAIRRFDLMSKGTDRCQSAVAYMPTHCYVIEILIRLASVISQNWKNKKCKKNKKFYFVKWKHIVTWVIQNVIYILGPYAKNSSWQQTGCCIENLSVFQALKCIFLT